MTREAFDTQLGRLSMLAGMPVDSDGHWEALRDVPDELLTSAVGYALRTRKWFPVPVELRQDVDAVKPRTFYVPPEDRPAETFTEHIPNPFGGKGITVTVANAARFHCPHCDDTGWRAWWCGERSHRMDWLDASRCGRRSEHAGHDWAQRCQCVDSNPVLLRKREAQAQYAAQREDTRR